MRATREANGSLLGNTLVLFGGKLGRAKAHNHRKPPIILAEPATQRVTR